MLSTPEHAVREESKYTAGGRLRLRQPLSVTLALGHSSPEERSSLFRPLSPPPPKRQGPRHSVLASFSHGFTGDFVGARG